MKTLFKKIVIAILTIEARIVLARFKPKIVAITGSVGKTSTKDAIYSVIAENFSARRSEKSFNGEIGIPLTILGLPNGWNNPFIWFKNIISGFLLIFSPRYTLHATRSSGYPEWLVLEVGADHPGDIESLTKWLKPDAVVITRLSEVPVHVEFFKSPKDVIKEKSFLVHALKDTGTLFLNADDKDVMSFREIKRQCRLVTFGEIEPADFQASHIDITYSKTEYGDIPTGTTFKVDHNGNSMPVNLSNRLGRQHIYPALSALAVGDSLGLNIVDMTQSLSEYEAPRGRMAVIKGIKYTTIIDDTYNSSPIAVAEALRTLGEIKTKGNPRTQRAEQSSHDGKKIAVLGDMLELGKYSVDEHKKAGKEVAKVVDILITVGMRARDIADGALNNEMSEKNIFQFDESVEAGKYVQAIMEKGDVVLVKGSQGVRMEKIVEEIMAEPERAGELLVRQEPEWQNR